MKNVEIKARVNDLEKITKIAEEISGSTGKIITQDDVFYKCSHGRMKMRTYEDKSATLIRYERSDKKGPKLSDYTLVNLTADQAKELHDILSTGLGVRGEVHKKRTLYMVGQTRVHIDVVENLGNFMELEVVLTPDQTLEEGQLIAQGLQEKLYVKNEDLLECAYIDMLDTPK